MRLIDRLQSWVGGEVKSPLPKKPEETPATDLVEWARPLAATGQVVQTDLHLIGEIERWTKQNKAAVLQAALELPERSFENSQQVYRLSNQVEDGAVVGQALKLYQGVIQGQDRFSPAQRETLFLNLLHLHQNAERAHAGYQAYVKGQADPEDRLLGDMSTVNPSQDRWRNAESIYSLFEVARALPEHERPLFMSIFETHGVYPNQGHSNRVKEIWSHVTRQPDRSAATAGYLELRQLFADRHPPRGLFPNEDLDSADNRSGFACRVLGEENEGLPVFTAMWRQLDCDPAQASAAMKVLRERMGSGLAALSLKDALAVYHGLEASRSLAGVLQADAGAFLAEHFSAQDWSVVMQALARVSERDPAAASRLVGSYRESPTQARRERLLEVCANAILYDGDAELGLDELPADRRGITVTENRVQIGQVSLKRRNLEAGPNP